MKKTIISIAVIIMLVAIAFAVTGCGENKGVVGQWAYSSFIYTFNADKTGSYGIAGGTKNFTYEDDGEKLSILYEGNTSPLVLKYRIDGNKLIITDSFGKDVEYVKK